jgi:hypothetical protein
MTTRARIGASYVLGMLGYGLGMAFSLLGEVPAGLLLLSTTCVLAIALFRSEVAA